MNSQHSYQFYPTAILGYRGWWRDGARLSSITSPRDGIWEPDTRSATPDVFKAKCVSEKKHSAPEPRCGCGYYAFHHLNSARRLGGEGLVIGAVAGAGKVQIHRQGFRAQRVQLLALLGENDPHRALPAVSNSYRVPVFSTPRDLEDFVAGLHLYTPDDRDLYTGNFLQRWRTRSRDRAVQHWRFHLR